MDSSTAFLQTPSTRWIGRGFRNVPKSSGSTSCPRTVSQTTMIQRPDREGPPDLDDFFSRKSSSMAQTGEPVMLSTGRALLKNNNNNVSETCLAALSTAQQSLPSQPQLLHCTFSLDFDAQLVAQTLQEQMKVPILGRSVNKKGSSGAIEILLLSSEQDNGISFASVTTDATQGEEAAAKSSAASAASKAVDGLVSRDSCTFMMFCHTPGEDAAVRRGLDEAFPGVTAYGGPAVGNEVSGTGWALLGSDSVQAGSSDLSKTVHLAAIPGSLSFLYSAVIKNWAQPVYVEPLSYMSPSYIGDPQQDLLTAVRYDDWEKFVWCLETNGIDVNTTWKHKQNQSPLLAACARARTEMIKYLLDHGADVGHRNDGGFTASMYTRMLIDYDRSLILNQLKMLEDAGCNTQLTKEEKERLTRATGGRVVE